MKQKNTKILCGILLLLFAAFGLALSMRPKQIEPISRSAFLLDTFVTVTLYDKEDPAILDQCIALCKEYENRFSKTIETSEIYRLNHRSLDETTFQLSPDTADIIREGIEYSRLSDGTYDLTIEPLSSLWDFTAQPPSIPPEQSLRDAAKKVNYKNLKLEGTTLTFLSPDTTLDLGSIAKGFIADRLKDYLKSQNVNQAIINLGGNVLCVGQREKNTPFHIGLQKPFDSYQETIANLNIDDLSVVSSGVYERHFFKDGKNYHHILDPKTGYPFDNGLISVTIVSPRSIDGDALSTTCFSLGLEKGLELINSMDGIYGYFITEDYKIHYSNGAENLLDTQEGFSHE